MPTLGPITMEKGTQMNFSHPASIFIKKQQDLVKKGYTEHKAFQIVGAEIQSIFEKHKDETRVLRGVAL